VLSPLRGTAGLCVAGESVQNPGDGGSESLPTAGMWHAVPRQFPVWLTAP